MYFLRGTTGEPEIVTLLLSKTFNPGSKGAPMKLGVRASVDTRVRTCKESRAKRDRTGGYLRPPFLGTPSAPSRKSAPRHIAPCDHCGCCA